MAGAEPVNARRCCRAAARPASAWATLASALATAPSAWCWSARARSPALVRRATSAAMRCVLVSRSRAVSASMRARCHCHQASRTVAATRSCAAVARLSMAAVSASARAALRPRSPGSHSGTARPISSSRAPWLRLRRSVLFESSSAAGSGVQLCAATCCARAASRRACSASASGWRAQAASKAWRRFRAAAVPAAVWGDGAAAGRSGPVRPCCRRPRQRPRWRAAAGPARLSFEFLGASDAPVLKTTHGRSASGDHAVASGPMAPQAAARTQARTGVRKGRDPPRRSGEEQPLRAFGSGRRVGARGFVEGGAGRRRRERAGQTRRQSQHHAAGAVAVPAVQVDGAGGLVALGISVGQQVGCLLNAWAGISLTLVLVRMFVMPEVSSVRLSLVRAIRGHRRPAELER